MVCVRVFGVKVCGFKVQVVHAPNPLFEKVVKKAKGIVESFYATKAESLSLSNSGWSLHGRARQEPETLKADTKAEVPNPKTSTLKSCAHSTLPLRVCGSGLHTPQDEALKP